MSSGGEEKEEKDDDDDDDDDGLLRRGLSRHRVYRKNHSQTQTTVHNDIRWCFVTLSRTSLERQRTHGAARNGDDDSLNQWDVVWIAERVWTANDFIISLSSADGVLGMWPEIQ